VASAAAEAGRRLLSRLRALAARHPAAIRDVRGRGLILGLELATAFEGSSFLRYLAQTGWLGYAVAGFLLRAHGIRVAPALSSRNTLRLEPACSVPEEAIDRLLLGLEDLCLTLEGQDAAGLVAPGLGVTLRRGGAARATPARARRPVADGAPHV